MFKSYIFTKIKNLFPQDTRSAELLSSISIIFSIIYIILTSSVALLSSKLLIITAVVGLLQFISLVFFEHCDKGRVASALLVGAIMFHLGIIHFQSSIFSFFHFLATGVVNIYAFLLNNQRVKWR
jgi:hypothetical protein